MRRPFFKGVVLGVIVSMAVLAAGTALAGTGVGAVFNLGRANSVDNRSLLRGTVATRNLQIINDGTGTALDLRVKPGVPPMTVSSDARVINLNADQLDGMDSSQLLHGSGTAVHSRLAEPADSANRTMLTVPGFGTVETSCDPNNGYRIFWRNASGGTLDSWWTSNGATTYIAIAAGSGSYLAFDVNDDQLITLVAGTATRTATVHTTTRWTASGCLFLSEALAQ